MVSTQDYTVKNVMIYVWWNIKCVVYNEELYTNNANNVIYCSQLQPLYKNLQKK